MDSHVHVSGLEFWHNGVCAIILIGLLNLLARKFPNNRLAQTWLYIFTPGASQHNGN